MLWGVSITKLANAVITLRRANLQDKYDMLFDAWDTHQTGTVRFVEVEQGLKRLKASSEELHVEVVSEAAVKALPPNTHAETHTFDRKEFKHFAENLVLEMNQPFSVVSELLLLGALDVQPRDEQEFARLREIKDGVVKLSIPGVTLSKDGKLFQGKVDEEAKVAEFHKSLSGNTMVGELFKTFNTSGTGRLSFSEVAHMLHKLRQDVSLRQARAETINLMLLLDTDSERSLGIIEFARFLQKISTLMCMDAQVLAGILLEIANEEKAMTLDDSATALLMETQNPISQVYETLGDRKLHLLFELWDKDADGTISFAEVSLGLRKFCHDSEPANETAADAAEALLIFDADSDQRLDWADFARFINHFCDSCGSDFSTLSEYLILLAALEDNPTEELAFLLSEDKVERAIVEVDTLWRKDGGTDASPSGGDTSTLTEGMKAVKLDEDGDVDEASENEPAQRSLQRVTSDLHRNMRASPFDLDGSQGAQASHNQDSEEEPPPGGLQGHGSSLGGRKLGGLKSMRSRMSYQAAP